MNMFIEVILFLLLPVFYPIACLMDWTSGVQVNPKDANETAIFFMASVVVDAIIFVICYGAWYLIRHI